MRQDLFAAGEESALAHPQDYHADLRSSVLFVANRGVAIRALEPVQAEGFVQIVKDLDIRGIRHTKY